MSDATQSPAVRRFGAFEINPQSGELRKNGMRLRLSGQPFQVLALLIERAGDLVTREELQSKLWAADTFVDFDHGLNNAVARIREVLDDSSDAPRYVETVPRRGYRFIAPVIDAASSRDPLAPAQAPAESGPAAHPAASRTTASSRLIGGVAVLAVLAAGLALYYGRRVTATRPPAIKSLAVLPLKNLSGDLSQEYLADGMTEELIGRLSMISGLRVISRTPTMHFKDTQLSAPEIAKALNVDALVEGSVIRDGNRVRVHAQLIRATTDEHFWSEEYDREIVDVLALQSEIAQAVARRVEVTVTGNERARLVAARHVAPEVYESYLKGLLVKGLSKADYEQRIAYFEETIRKDPTFAPAYAALASAYGDLSTSFVGGPSPDAVLPKELRAIQKALELDPGLAEAHALLAETYKDSWRWAEAESEFKLALELNPNDPSAHIGLANWLVCQGRFDEALSWSQRARELDPLEVSGMQNGWILFEARRYDEAVRELRSVLAVHPEHTFAQFALGHSLIGSGHPDEAIPVFEKIVSSMQRSPGSIEGLATAHAYAGHRNEALRLVDELKRIQATRHVSTGAFIGPYLALGDYEQAFALLERGYQDHSGELQYLKVDPIFDPIRADPRFKDLLHRVGLDH